MQRYCAPERAALASVIHAKKNAPKFTTLTIKRNSSGRIRANSIRACPSVEVFPRSALLTLRSFRLGAGQELLEITAILLTQMNETNTHAISSGAEALS